MFDNRKIKHLRKLPEGNNIVLIWVMLLTMAGRCNANGMIFLTENILYTPKMLADELNFDENTVLLALKFLEDFGMICRDGKNLMIVGWEEHQNIEGMDKIREQNRLRKQKQRERQQLMIEADMSRDMSRDVTQQNKNKKENIEEDIYINSASSNAPSKKDVSDFFESVWKLYPNKKGKGQVSDSKKKKLYEIGYEEISRAIERYNSDLKKEDWRKPQNGSTFFNSGYVDYLDANYSPLPEKREERKPVTRNKFNNAPQRTYEMDALERMLLEQQNFKPETDANFLAEAEALQRELQEKYGR